MEPGGTRWLQPGIRTSPPAYGASKADTKRLVALGWVMPWIAAGPPGTSPAERHRAAFAPPA
jgi:hypothetical protein